MMLCKLALKNITKSIKDYAIYFFTLILGVAIFYVFNAIESQAVMMDVSESTYDIVELMTTMLSGVSVFVSFILGFLIIYASRFLMKRRNKEFAIYLTLGMGKRKISLILFLEVLLIGFVSLVVGLVIGAGLSQLMSILVANMFEADMTNFQFIFSSSACMKTLIYFGIMYLLVMIFNTYNVSRCKLIDLLYSSKKTEKVKLKNSWVCTIVFLIACGILGYAYYLVTGGITRLNNPGKILIPIAMGAVGTFLVFWSLSGLLLKLFMGMKNIYYRGLNSFTLRQFSSKINTTVFSMTVICLMLFVTVCVLSSALSIRNSMTANLKTLAPVDIELYKNLDMAGGDIEGYVPYTFEQSLDSQISVRETMERLGFDVDQNFKDILEFDVYATNDIKIEDTLGRYYEIAKKQFPQLAFDSAETFMRESDYNRLAEVYDLKPVTLEDDEYVIVSDFDSWTTIRNDELKTNPVIHLLGKDYYPKYDECINGFLHISSNHINIGFFVVPDEAVDDTIRQQGILLANYNASSKEGKQEIESMIMETEKSSYAPNTRINASTKISIYEGSVGLGAMITFIGLYLGIIFLVASAAILALKELSESSDNKERFSMLRKIGTDEKMLNRALFRQIAIFFFFPLLIAIIHSIFGIMFCDYILETFGDEQLLLSIVMTAFFIVIIYGGYFLLTYFCSKNMMKEQR